MIELKNKPIQVAEHQAGRSLAQRIIPVLTFQALRARFGLTRNQIADLFGATPGTISNMENGSASSIVYANLMRLMRRRQFTPVAPRSTLN